MDADETNQPGPSVLEQDTSRSLAATLKLARAKGYVDQSGKNQQNNKPNHNHNNHKTEINAATRRDNNSKHRQQTNNARNNHSRDPRATRSRLVKEGLDYKPEINLEYTDDTGRKLQTPKEAFNYMCYKFHGKGPSKNKVDKRLKKQQLESAIKQSLSTDVPNSAALMISKQEELKTPFIVLSKGK